MEKRNQHIILIGLMIVTLRATATVSQIEEIIDRPYDPLMTLHRWDLEEALAQSGILSMPVRERVTLLKKFHNRSLQRASERELSSKEQLMSYLFRGVFGLSLMLTLKTGVNIAMPGRYGRLGQGFDSIFGIAYGAATLYSGIQVMKSFQKQQPLKAAQRRVVYFEQLLKSCDTP